MSSAASSTGSLRGTASAARNLAEAGYADPASSMSGAGAGRQMFEAADRMRTKRIWSRRSVTLNLTACRPSIEGRPRLPDAASRMFRAHPKGMRCTQAHCAGIDVCIASPRISARCRADRPQQDHRDWHQRLPAAMLIHAIKTTKHRICLIRPSHGEAWMFHFSDGPPTQDIAGAVANSSMQLTLVYVRATPRSRLPRPHAPLQPDDRCARRTWR